MNEEKPFEGENPFRKLDKKRFLSHDEKKKAKSLKKNGLLFLCGIRLSSG